MSPDGQCYAPALKKAQQITIQPGCMVNPATQLFANDLASLSVATDSSETSVA